MQKTEVNGVYKVSEGILINRDKAALKAYKAQKNKLARLNSIEEDVISLRKDVTEIKNLLKALVK